MNESVERPHVLRSPIGEGPQLVSVASVSTKSQHPQTSELRGLPNQLVHCSHVATARAHHLSIRTTCGAGASPSIHNILYIYILYTIKQGIFIQYTVYTVYIYKHFYKYRLYNIIYSTMINNY